MTAEVFSAARVGWVEPISAFTRVFDALWAKPIDAAAQTMGLAFLDPSYGLINREPLAERPLLGRNGHAGTARKTRMTQAFQSPPDFC